MFKLNKISISAASLALSALVSCVEMEEQQAGAVGYLAVPSLEVDVTVDDPAQTKALDFDIAAPAVSEVHFVVKDKDGNVKYDGEGLWAEPLVLPVGAYTVEATAGENGFDAPYFTGSASGIISPLGNEVPDLYLALGNALVCVSLDAGFAEHFTGENVTMASGTVERGFDDWFYVPSGSDLTLSLSGKNSAGNDVSFTHTLTAPAAKTAYSVVCKASSNNWPSISWTATELSDGAFEGGLYFKAAVVSNMSDANAADMKYQIKGGEYSDWTDVTVADVEEYKYISGLENGTAYTLRACVGNICSEEQTFRPVSFQDCLTRGEVSAAHNNAGNPSAELSGTTMAVKGMKVTLPSLINSIASVIVTGSFESSVNGATGSVSSTLSSTAKDVAFANADGWPYLPQGSYAYTANVTCELPGDRTVTAGLVGSVAVPAPEFTLSLSAYTSYDKYAATNGIAKDLNGSTGANNCDPATLYNAGGQWSISPSLMANGNYAKTLVVNIDGNADRTFNVTNEYGDNKYYENISGLAWQSHSLTVSLTFDGKTVSKSQTHHITGLPHKAPSIVKFNAGTSSWAKVDGNKTSVASDLITLRSGVGDIKGNEPEVNGPKFNIPSDIRTTISMDCNIYSQQVVIWYRCTLTVKVNGQSIISQESGKNTSNNYSLSGDATFTPSANYIVMGTNVYAVEQRYAEVSRVDVLYAN